MLSRTSFTTDSFFSSKASSFNSSRSIIDLDEFSYEFINSSYNFFSLITFCEFDLSCQKLDSSIF